MMRFSWLGPVAGVAIVLAALVFFLGSGNQPSGQPDGQAKTSQATKHDERLDQRLEQLRAAHAHSAKGGAAGQINAGAGMPGRTGRVVHPPGMRGMGQPSAAGAPEGAAGDESSETLEE